MSLGFAAFALSSLRSERAVDKVFVHEDGDLLNWPRDGKYKLWQLSMLKEE